MKKGLLGRRTTWTLSGSRFGMPVTCNMFARGSIPITHRRMTRRVHDDSILRERKPKVQHLEAVLADCSDRIRTSTTHIDMKGTISSEIRTPEITKISQKSSLDQHDSLDQRALLDWVLKNRVALTCTCDKCSSGTQIDRIFSVQQTMS
jgi:hypothetical protein